MLHSLTNNQYANVSNGNFSCCSQKSYVQDQICFPFNIIPVTNSFFQELYVAGINPTKLFSTGTIFVSSAPVSRIITLNFYIGGSASTLVNSVQITPGTTLSFTQSGFDTIELAVSACHTNTPNITGNVCMTVRYPVN